MSSCIASRGPAALAFLFLLLGLIFGLTLIVSAQQPAPIQIAWAGPLTGDIAQLGQGYLNGVQLAFDEWNANSPW